MALEEDDSCCIDGLTVVEDKKKKMKAPQRKIYHVNKCTLARAIEGESIFTLNEAPSS